MTRQVPVLPIVVLALLVALTFWLSRYGQQPDKVDLASRTDPDLIIEDFAAHKLSATGDLEYGVKAGRMSHFGNDDSSILEQVEFTAVQPGKPRMSATAPIGTLVRRKGAADEVILEGGVQVATQADAKFPSMLLSTPRLVVIPDQNLAHSREGVKIESPGSELVARSFTLNTETRRVVFQGIDLRYAPRGTGKRNPS